MKRSINSLFGGFMSASRLDEILLRNAAVVVAFHRIRDAPDSDGLSVGTAMFERLCRFFMREFRVVPLRDIVERLERGCRLDHHLAMTFDDGYRDNFDNAMPILERLSLPATFFVVSDWVSRATVPGWYGRAGVQYPLMTWDQVRTLRRKGFDIGAHTRTHLDLGQIDEAGAWDEIAGGRRELEQRLEAPIDLFAFPYGRRDNFAEPWRDLVKAAGYRCCCSCHGGITTTGSDPFHLARVPISPWYGSAHPFGFEVAFGRTETPAVYTGPPRLPPLSSRAWPGRLRRLDAD
jgi:peptidoglycan/xylan/chitin deacetylase (PgdA/CDA1 family)